MSAPRDRPMRGSGKTMPAGSRRTAGGHRESEPRFLAVRVGKGGSAPRAAGVSARHTGGPRGADVRLRPAGVVGTIRGVAMPSGPWIPGSGAHVVSGASTGARSTLRLFSDTGKRQRNKRARRHARADRRAAGDDGHSGRSRTAAQAGNSRVARLLGADPSDDLASICEQYEAFDSTLPERTPRPLEDQTERLEIE